MSLSAFKLTALAAVAAVFAAAGSGLAQAGPKTPKRPTGPDAGDRPTRSGQSKEQTVTGKVVRSKLVDLRGTDRRELVVLVRTDGGKEQIVDLGTSSRLKTAKVRTGNTITARGRTHKIGEHTVLMASRVTADGKTLAVDRRAEPDRPAGGYPIGSQTRRLTGDLVGVKSSGLRDGQGEHTVVRLYSPDARYHVVDLGPPDGLAELGLEVGDRVAVQGRDVLIDDKTLVLAYRVTANGKTVAVERSSAGRSPAQSANGAKAAGRRTVVIAAANMKFRPAEVVADPGEKLTVRLENRGDHKHNIEFELPAGEVELEQPLAPGRSGTVALTAPTKPGRYTFYCPVGDHKEKGMTGRLVVRQGK